MTVFSVFIRKALGYTGLAISIGDKPENYSPTGSIGFTVDEVVIPFKAAAAHVGADVLPYFCVFKASFDISSEEIAVSAQSYIKYITSCKQN